MSDEGIFGGWEFEPSIKIPAIHLVSLAFLPHLKLNFAFPTDTSPASETSGGVGFGFGRKYVAVGKKMFFTVHAGGEILMKFNNCEL